MCFSEVRACEYIRNLCAWRITEFVNHKSQPMKHFYFLCGTILLINGVMAREIRLVTSNTAVVHVVG